MASESEIAAIVNEIRDRVRARHPEGEAPGIGVALLRSGDVDESTTTPRNSPFAFGFVAATLMTAPDQSDFDACTLVESEQATPSSTAKAPLTNLV